KIAAPDAPADRPPWMHAALLVVAAVEIAAAAWLALDRASPRPLVAAAALGAAFVVAALVAPASWSASGGCGCLGAVRMEQGHRVLAGGALVLLVGLRLALAPPSGGTRGKEAAR